MRLKDQVVLLTDAESANGRALAQRFIDEGAQLIVRTDVEDARHADTNPARICCDPTNEKQVRALIEETIRRYGRLDVLVSNIQEVQPMTLETATDAQMQHALSRNCAVAFFFTQAAARHMRKQRKGKIIYVGSIHSDKPAGGALGFSLAMGAVEMLCREVALDLMGYQVQSLFVQCGAMAGDDDLFSSTITPFYDHFEDKIPGGKFVTHQEIHDLLVYLASCECTAFNGATLCADHGFMLHYIPRGTYEEQGVDAHE